MSENLSYEERKASKKTREQILSRTLAFHMSETTWLDGAPTTYRPPDRTALRLATAVLILLVLVLTAAFAATKVHHDVRQPGSETEFRGERVGGPSPVSWRR